MLHRNVWLKLYPRADQRLVPQHFFPSQIKLEFDPENAKKVRRVRLCGEEYKVRGKMPYVDQPWAMTNGCVCIQEDAYLLKLSVVVTPDQS